MTKANTARQSGDDLQAMLFMIECCKLLHDHKKIKEVGFEVNNAKSFDDIKVSYDEPISDGYGENINTDYISVKFHMLLNRGMTCDDLIKPEFIGATKESLLFKALRLQKKHAPDGNGCRFILRQPYSIADNDLLGELLDQRIGSIRLKELYTGGPNSKMGKLRAMWCNHLNIDEKELVYVLKPLRIHIKPELLDDTEERLNSSIHMAGLKPVQTTHLSNPYIDIPKKLSAERGEVILDREKFIVLMKREELYLGPPLNHKINRKLGLKSFSLYTSHLDSLTDNYYSFVDLFEGRQIKDPDFWNSRIYPEIVSFFMSNIEPGDNIHLYLECHNSITYAAGYASARCNAKIGPDQKGIPWFVSDRISQSSDELWKITPYQLQKDGDIAVAISITKNVFDDVKRTIDDLNLSIGLLIEATILPNVHQESVQGGDHAFLLSQELIQHIQKALVNNARKGCIHIFAAVPKSIMFFMGQGGFTLPQVQLYEYSNLEYSKSILLKQA